RPVDVGHLLGEIVSVYGAAATAGEPQVRFTSSLDEPARVSGREGPLGQVFRNLLDNARSFSPAAGEVRVELDRDSADPARPVRIRIDAHGPGIPAENLETIFERFYTSRPKGAAFGGNSGLGLSIARQIVEAHGGHIR